jgi:RimJ/RimL family protein N-acetyltransferase
VSLDAADGNLGSQAVARTSGFTETGRDRSCYLVSDGRVVDLVRFDLLADEWRSRHQSP